MNVENLYDEVAPRYDEVVAATEYIGPILLEDELPKDLNPSLILDLGCANGVLGRILKKTYPAADLVGFDISREMIELAKTLHVYNGLHHRDLNDGIGSTLSKKADLIVGLGFCEFLAQPESLIKELGTILNPGGVLMLTFQEYWPHNPKLAPRKTHSGSVIHNAYSIEEVVNKLSGTNLIVKKVESKTGYVSRAGFTCPYVFVTAIAV